MGNTWCGWCVAVLVMSWESTNCKSLDSSLSLAESWVISGKNLCVGISPGMCCCKPIKRWRCQKYLRIHTNVLWLRSKVMYHYACIGANEEKQLFCMWPTKKDFILIAAIFQILMHWWYKLNRYSKLGDYDNIHWLSQSIWSKVRKCSIIQRQFEYMKIIISYIILYVATRLQN